MDDAIHRSIRILKESFQGEMNENNVEIGIVDAQGKFSTLEPTRIKDFLDEV